MTVLSYPKPQLGGLEELTTDKGIYQHADKHGNPIVNPEMKIYPYSADDVARLLQVVARYPKFDAKWFQEIPKMVLDFFHKAKRSDGLCSNYRLEDGSFIEQKDGTLYDVFGRILTGAAEFASSKHKLAPEFEKFFFDNIAVARDIISKQESPHALAFTGNAFAEMIKYHAENRKRPGPLTESIMACVDITRKLLRKYLTNKSDDWKWPSNEISYCSWVIPHAVIAASQPLVLREQTYMKVGLEMLDFYLQQVYDGEMFKFVGNGEKGNTWFKRGKIKPLYDQQTVEGRIAETCSLAHNLTQDSRYNNPNKDAIKWFFGNNSKDALLVDGGRVRDGITDTQLGYNENTGAESRLSLLLAKSTLHS